MGSTIVVSIIGLKRNNGRKTISAALKYLLEQNLDKKLWSMFIMIVDEYIYHHIITHIVPDMRPFMLWHFEAFLQISEAKI